VLSFIFESRSPNPAANNSHGPWFSAEPRAFCVAWPDFSAGVRISVLWEHGNPGEKNQYENFLINHQLFPKQILGEMVSGIADRFIETTADYHPNSDRQK
jgi:hypothetical protein